MFAGKTNDDIWEYTSCGNSHASFFLVLHRNFLVSFQEPAKSVQSADVRHRNLTFANKKSTLERQFYISMIAQALQLLQICSSIISMARKVVFICPIPVLLLLIFRAGQNAFSSSDDSSHRWWKWIQLIKTELKVSCRLKLTEVIHKSIHKTAFPGIFLWDLEVGNFWGWFSQKICSGSNSPRAPFR